MLRAIECKDKRFQTKDNNNFFSPITANTIILCCNYRLMNSLAEEILKTSGSFAIKRTDEIDTFPPYKEFIYSIFII